jgi:hypothetical protein
MIFFYFTPQTCKKISIVDIDMYTHKKTKKHVMIFLFHTANFKKKKALALSMRATDDHEPQKKGKRAKNLNKKKP